MDNTLNHKPAYTAHRRGLIAADAADLAVLLGTNERSAIHVGGYDTLHGFIEAAAGNVTLMLLELVEYETDAGVSQSLFVQRGANIGPLIDGDTFEVATPGGGRWFLRAEAVTTGPASVYVAGGTRANEGSIYG